MARLLRSPIRPVLRSPLRPATGLTLSKGGADLLSLFRNGEDGFLFGDFTELDELLTAYNGMTSVASDGDAVGQAFDDHAWPVGGLATYVAQAAELVRNTGNTGAAVGTPGTAPTNWAIGYWGGTTTQITYVGNNANGDPCIRVRCSGTVSGGGFAVAFEPGNFIAAVAGETFRTSAQVSLVAGSLAGLSALTMAIDENNSSGSFLALQGGVDYKGIIDSTPRTISLIARFGNASTAFTKPYVWLTAANGSVLDFTIEIAMASCKKVRGNHGLQATSTKRPFWKANSGKPYLLFDGSDDSLNSPFVPTAALTVALAFNSPTGNAALLGGGDSAGNRRAFLGLNSLGYLGGGWGGQSFANIVATVGVDIRSADHVGLMTADATSVDLYLDGALVYTGAPSGSPSGATSPIALGGFNNGGTPASFSNAREYAALAVNRRVTPAEIALITSKFRSAYQ